MVGARLVSESCIARMMIFPILYRRHMIAARCSHRRSPQRGWPQLHNKDTLVSNLHLILERLECVNLAARRPFEEARRRSFGRGRFDPGQAEIAENLTLSRFNLITQTTEECELDSHQSLSFDPHLFRLFIMWLCLCLLRCGESSIKRKKRRKK